ncbi:MAG TPA: acyl-CoA synthetase [Burkholderiales bacterium]|nr:acyl-CoA synthetase [Burkholderiales bacterium]
MTRRSPRAVFASEAATLPDAARPAAWSAERERGSPIAVALFAWATLALGRRATRWLLHPICWYFIAFSPRTRWASRTFLRRALGREPRSGDVLRHFHTFAATVHDRVLLLSGGLEGFDIEVQGGAIVESILRSGRGCILLGSHLGSFEVLRALGRATNTRAVNVVMHSQNAMHTARAFGRIAPELKDRIIAPGQPDAMLKVKECLEKGEIVGILGDRLLRGAKAGSRGFLGVPARFPLGPLQLACTLGAPVVTCFALYEGASRYRICIETLSAGGAVPRAERAARVAGWLDRYVERLEHQARRSPYNWFNFYDFWNEIPG